MKEANKKNDYFLDKKHLKYFKERVKELETDIQYWKNKISTAEMEIHCCEYWLTKGFTE